MTALCLLYLDNSFADPSSSKSTRFDNEINFFDFSDLIKILPKPCLSFLSLTYCWIIIGYSFPSLLNLVTTFPPYKVSRVLKKADEGYLISMLPRIIAKCPGKVHTYSYSPAIVGAVKDMLSDSPGPSNLV